MDGVKSAVPPVLFGLISYHSLALLLGQEAPGTPGYAAIKVGSSVEREST